MIGVQTDAVIRNAFCSYYGRDSRGFTRALVRETTKLLDACGANPLYQGNEFRTDTLFNRQTVSEYINNLRERREGKLSMEQTQLLEKISR